MRRALTAIALALLAQSAAAQTKPSAASPVVAPAVAQSWRQLTLADVGYVEGVVPTHYIYAVHPGGPAWDAKFKGLIARARREASGVTSYGGYRAVITHLVAGFEDAHFGLHLALDAQAPKWPGFLVRWRGERYVVVFSMKRDIAVGAEVESCDGRPLDAWVDQLAELEGGPKGLVTTRAALAGRIFLDKENPFFALPKSCRIGGKDVALAWSPASTDAFGAYGNLERVSLPFEQFRDPSVTVSDFGANGAWVHIGTMMPATKAEADQFNALIAQAPQLRSMDVIVLDVRGNPGGSYGWFMAFLRGLYGSEYADYYARARLEIANTMLVVSKTGADNPGFTPEMTAIKMPADPPMDGVLTGPSRTETLPNGERLVFMAAPVTRLSPLPASPPAPATRAKVYVVTDYGCASACLSFMDEIMRFPGVVQVGTETHIDRRSGGWPENFDLPSGLGYVRMGRLVRDNRKRGENEPWVPKYAFTGDIADTEAVKRWVATEVVPKDAAR